MSSFLGVDALEGGRRMKFRPSPGSPRPGGQGAKQKADAVTRSGMYPPARASSSLVANLTQFFTFFSAVRIPSPEIPLLSRSTATRVTDTSRNLSASTSPSETDASFIFHWTQNKKSVDQHPAAGRTPMPPDPAAAYVTKFQLSISVNCRYGEKRPVATVDVAKVGPLKLER